MSECRQGLQDVARAALMVLVVDGVPLADHVALLAFAEGVGDSVVFSCRA